MNTAHRHVVGRIRAAWIATPSSVWYDFLTPLLVGGLGMGCIFAPLSTVAMRDVQPQLAGAASGLLNTNRQVGAVIGTSAVGALLQNQLGSALASEASQRAGQLPPGARAGFLASFRDAVKSGVQVGAGQNGTSAKLPSGLPQQVVLLIGRLAHDVFTNAFVTAMRATMVLPIAVIGIAALSCLAIKSGKPAAAAPPAESADLRMRA